MPLESFNPTKAERGAIERAWNWLAGNTRDSYRSEQFLKDERSGYGKTSDKVPLIVAKGLCVKWYLDGVCDPDRWQLKDCYYMRPAAIWFTGMGAAESNKATVPMSILQDAALAFEDACARAKN